MTPEASGIVIVGAGLCGLALAEALIARGERVTVLEGRSRVGGRILSPKLAEAEYPYDMGPAWIWPHNQRMLALIQRLGLSLMPQHASGRLVFEDQRGAVRRDLDFATMAGALRLQGGLAQLTARLAAALPEGTLSLNHQVTQISVTGTGVEVTGKTPQAVFTLREAQVVLALPPRLVADLSFQPVLAPEMAGGLRAVPTWMAGQGKLVAIYPSAFWRAAGLSGDGISHRGPLVEIHDAAPVPAPEGEAALFGFLHPEALHPDLSDAEVRQQALDQLTRLYGPEAATPKAVLIKRWGQAALTATARDHTPLREHPTYRPLGLSGTDWAGRLFLSGSETAAQDGGFLEGALEAADHTLAELLRGRVDG